MAFDPFRATQGQGQGAQDPFGGPVPRRANNLPGGDPFGPTTAARGAPKADGNITPHIEVEIAGDPQRRRDDIKNFSLRVDIQQLYDPFSFSLVNPRGELNYILDEIDKRHWVPIRIYHSDPFVDNGTARLWSRGVILRGQNRSGMSGSIISLSGYDLGWLLTSDAPFGRDSNLQGLSWPQLAQKLIDKSWLQPGGGLGSLLGTNQYGLRTIIGVSTGRQIRQGRIDAQTARLRQEAQDLVNRSANRQEITIANNLNFKAFTPKIMVRPGEKVSDILTRYAKFDRRFINVTPDGDLAFFKPDYSTPPQFVFNYNFDERTADRNNVLDGGRTCDGEPVANLVECVGSLLYGLTIAEQDNPTEGLTWGFADQRTAADYYLRRRTFQDNERYNNGRCEQRALWNYNQGIYQSETVNLTVQGHSQDGIPFAENSRATVRSDKLFVTGSDNRVMYLSAVEYKQSEHAEGISSTAELTLKKDRLWAA